ncbi:MAG TPA: glycoside hydrolase family 16 protein [Armatimonadota bacterium]|nr:glycoside hydrolase family 16 protein [Armatimonadota bacterium]
MNKFVLDDHAPSFLPEQKNWKLVWNDEFDGTTLDTSKWGFRLNYWGYPSPTFTTEGVHLDGNSHVQLHLLKKDGEFYSPHLQTGSNTFDLPKDTNGFWPFGKMEEPKFMHRFGYYEIRCRLPKNDGWHAAFWLQSPSIGAAPNPKYCGVECDIMENYRQYEDGLIGCGNGWGGYGKDCKWYGHFWFPHEETPDGWHYYGVDWSRDGYTFYADGKKIGVQEAPVSEVEQFILVSTECHGYHVAENRGGLENSYHPTRKADEKLHKAVLPDYFEVDFVRVFDEI